MIIDPIRLFLEAARLSFRISTELVRLPLSIAQKLLGHDERPRAEAARPDRQAEEREPAEARPSRARPQAAPSRPAPTVTATPPASAPTPEPPSLEPEEPVHIDDEPELVAEFAEPGAEDGVGAQLHVDEPWDGYKRMKVADIRDRIGVADMTELAVIQLYEGTNRKRRSILDAAERRSRQLANEANAANAGSNGR